MEAKEIDFNPAIFNNIYWHIRAAFENILLRFIWVYGGSSASKTYSVVQMLIIKMMEDERETALVLRKYGTDIRDSIYADFLSVIKDWELEDEFICQINYIECKSTGAFIRFRGLDDSEKVKGIAGFKRIILEEVSQFDQIDLKQIRKRLRGKEGQQIIGIFNPISEDHWIKKNVFDMEELAPIMPPVRIGDDLVPVDAPINGMWVNARGNLVVMKTNYLDNKFIVGPNFVDQHTIDDFEKDKIDDYNYYEVYGLGNWGRIRTGGEFWKDFKYATHVTKAGYNPALPVWGMWDDNVHPWPTFNLFQIYGPDNNIMRNGVSLKGKYVVVQVDEINLEDPRNNQRESCNEFIRRYPPAVLKKIFIGGDRTAMKEDTKLEKGENFYTQIQNYLADYRPELKMQRVNPSVVDSKDFVNDIFRGGTDIVFFVNENCRKSINDYQYCLEDADGGVAKIKVLNKATGVRYEPYGHASDVLRYLFTVAFSGQYGSFLSGGRKRIPKPGKNISKNALK